MQEGLAGTWAQKTVPVFKVVSDIFVLASSFEARKRIRREAWKKRRNQVNWSRSTTSKAILLPMRRYKPVAVNKLKEHKDVGLSCTGQTRCYTSFRRGGCMRGQTATYQPLYVRVMATFMLCSGRRCVFIVCRGWRGDRGSPTLRLKSSRVRKIKRGTVLCMTHIIGVESTSGRLNAILVRCVHRNVVLSWSRLLRLLRCTRLRLRGEVRPSDLHRAKGKRGEYAPELVASSCCFSYSPSIFWPNCCSYGIVHRWTNTRQLDGLVVFSILIT